MYENKYLRFFEGAFMGPTDGVLDSVSYGDVITLSFGRS